MFSKDILDRVAKEGGIQKKKTQVEINQEAMHSKMNQMLEQNKYIEDAIARIKEQVAKGKEYKFLINRDQDGMIKEIMVAPI